MNIWSLARQFSYRQLYRLSVLMLQNPLLMYPTLKATKQTITICDDLYGKEHHKHGKANAFRHALWNVLICQKSFEMSKNERNSVVWAQKVTDLHEKLAPNDPLETAMDLHNNEIGRKCFNTLMNSSEEEVITVLKEKAVYAKKIIEIDEIVNHKNDLVYLTEE